MTDLDTRTRTSAENDTADTEALGAAQLAHAGRVVARVLKIVVGVAILAVMAVNFSPESLRGYPLGYLFGAFFGFGLLIDGLLGTRFFRAGSRHDLHQRSESEEIALGQGTGAGRYGFLKHDK